ncbi:MAG: hypothetical protein CMI26_05830 [Opitutae bacterium]|jgi:hypothetical protein|nr:hypothetical protein [Opitutae bacterium]|tara:strand:- start:32 stop:232 length:201 start_codon:yes stop_codon:yes gene_type:complete
MRTQKRNQSMVDFHFSSLTQASSFLRLSMGWGGHHPLGHLKSLFPVLALVAFVFAENAMPAHGGLD